MPTPSAETPPVYYIDDAGSVTGVTTQGGTTGGFGTGSADPSSLPVIPQPTEPLSPAPTSADFGGTDPVTQAGDFTILELVQMFIVYAFIIAAALSAIFIFVGGISFIISGGNDEKIKSAVNTIRYSIIGLVVTILSFTFVTIVGRMFGFNFLDYISYDDIRSRITRLLSSADEGGSGDSFTPRQ